MSCNISIFHLMCFLCIIMTRVDSHQGNWHLSQSMLRHLSQSTMQFLTNKQRSTNVYIHVQPRIKVVSKVQANIKSTLRMERGIFFGENRSKININFNQLYLTESWNSHFLNSTLKMLISPCLDLLRY